jgi:OmpA-OmpF porin, OOP family
MGILRASSLALLLFAAHAASAAEPGFYIGAGVGAAKHDVDSGGANGSILVFFGPFLRVVPRASLETDSDSTGWNAVLGYRVNRYFAAELEYLDCGTSKVRETYLIEFPFGGSTLIEQQFSTDVSGPAVSALGVLPLGPQFELFVRAGLLFTDLNVKMEQRSESPTYADRVAFGGVGVDWNFHDQWGARLEYRRSKDIEQNIDLAETHVELLSLAVLYRF